MCDHNKENMTIFVKNKHTLQISKFKLRCCIGKKGSTKKKKEGDKKTPKGTFEIEYLYITTIPININEVQYGK